MKMKKVLLFMVVSLLLLTTMAEAGNKVYVYFVNETGSTIFYVYSRSFGGTYGSNLLGATTLSNGVKKELLIDNTYYYFDLRVEGFGNVLIGEYTNIPAIENQVITLYAGGVFILEEEEEEEEEEDSSGCSAWGVGPMALMTLVALFIIKRRPK